MHVPQGSTQTTSPLSEAQLVAWRTTFDAATRVLRYHAAMMDVKLMRLRATQVHAQALPAESPMQTDAVAA